MPRSIHRNTSAEDMPNVYDHFAAGRDHKVVFARHGTVSLRSLERQTYELANPRIGIWVSNYSLVSRT